MVRVLIGYMMLACKLLKEVQKLTCDIHGLSDLNQYFNDDDPVMKRDFNSRVHDCCRHECNVDCLCID